MNMWDAIGVVGAIIISYSNIPQLIMFFRQGHAKGISYAATHVATVGVITRLAYQAHVSNCNMIILFPYACSFICIFITYYYLYFPREE